MVYVARGKYRGGGGISLSGRKSDLIFSLPEGNETSTRNIHPCPCPLSIQQFAVLGQSSLWSVKQPSLAFHRALDDGMISQAVTDNMLPCFMRSVCMSSCVNEDNKLQQFVVCCTTPHWLPAGDQSLSNKQTKSTTGCWERLSHEAC